MIRQWIDWMFVLDPNNIFKIIFDMFSHEPVATGEYIYPSAKQVRQLLFIKK